MSRFEIRRHWRWWLGGGVVAVIALAIAGPFIYIHAIEGSPAAKLTLPVKEGTAAETSLTNPSGQWNVGPGSQVGYRVNEVLLGQHTTAVGRSSDVSGFIKVAGSSVKSGEFTVRMSTVKSDQSLRNNRFDSSIMDVAKYPFAVLSLTSPIHLGTLPQSGTVVQYGVSASLTMHGVTHPVSFTVESQYVNGDVDILADVPIAFADWDIANPSIGGFVTTANQGTLEVLLILTRGSGNPSVEALPSPTTLPVKIAPVTVPSTTVPPLSLSTGGS